MGASSRRRERERRIWTSGRASTAMAMELSTCIGRDGSPHTSCSTQCAIEIEMG